MGRGSLLPRDPSGHHGSGSDTHLSAPLVQAEYSRITPHPQVLAWDIFPVFMAERSKQLWACGRTHFVLDGWCKFRWDGRQAGEGSLSSVHGIPQVNPDTGYINYDQLEENARLFHPKLIIAGDERGRKQLS